MNGELEIAEGQGQAEPAAILVLHRLRITGLATEDSIRAATGLPPQQVSNCVLMLVEKGWARTVTGKTNGFAITPLGYEAHLSLLDTTVFQSPVEEDLYARFAAQNEQFKSVCADWQVGPDGLPNDHSDAGYDRSVLARFWMTHEAIMLILKELEAVARHFDLYRKRLQDAARRVSEGDRSALLLPLSDSYHDIWMELHQDLRLAKQAFVQRTSNSGRA